MRRAAPSAMSEAETENRFFKSLQPSAKITRSTGAWLMRTGRKRVRAAAIGLDRIVVDRRSAVEPLGNHLKIRSKLALKDAGPSLRARKSASSRWIITPGVGIAEGDDDGHWLKLLRGERKDRV